MCICNRMHCISSNEWKAFDDASVPILEEIKLSTVLVYHISEHCPFISGSQVPVWHQVSNNSRSNHLSFATIARARDWQSDGTAEHRISAAKEKMAACLGFYHNETWTKWLIFYTRLC